MSRLSDKELRLNFTQQEQRQSDNVSSVRLPSLVIIAPKSLLSGSANSAPSSFSARSSRGDFLPPALAGVVGPDTIVVQIFQ